MDVACLRGMVLNMLHLIPLVLNVEAPYVRAIGSGRIVFLPADHITRQIR